MIRPLKLTAIQKAVEQLNLYLKRTPWTVIVVDKGKEHLVPEPTVENPNQHKLNFNEK